MSPRVLRTRAEKYGPDAGFGQRLRRDLVIPRTRRDRADASSPIRIRLRQLGLSTLAEVKSLTVAWNVT